MRLIAFALLAVVIVAEGRNHFLNNNVNVNGIVDVSEKSKTEDTPMTVEEINEQIHDIFGDNKPIVSMTPRIITKDNCKPGEDYNDGCNWCTCSEPGYTHICTRRGC